MTWALRELGVAATALGLAGALVWACAASPATEPTRTRCSSDPTACPVATTCWPAAVDASLECLPSHDAGTFGVACAQIVGQATCASGLACDQLGPDGGRCTYYCGASGAACPQGFDCHLTHVGGATGPTVELCRAAGDAGGATDGGGGAGDASIPAPTGGGGASDAMPAQR